MLFPAGTLDDDVDGQRRTVTRPCSTIRARSTSPASLQGSPQLTFGSGIHYCLGAALGPRRTAGGPADPRPTDAEPRRRRRHPVEARVHGDLRAGPPARHVRRRTLTAARRRTWRPLVAELAKPAPIGHVSNMCSIQVRCLAQLAPDFDAGFADVARVDLDATSWVEHAPDWLGGADVVFDELVERLPLRQRTGVKMFDQIVDEPRLTAWWNTCSGEPEPLDVLRDVRHDAVAALRRGVRLDRVQPVSRRQRFGRLARRPASPLGHRSGRRDRQRRAPAPTSSPTPDCNEPEREARHVGHERHARGISVTATCS